AELRQRGIMIGATSTISRWLRRAGLTHKKSLRAAEQDRADVARERKHWRVWQRFMDPARFVFLDETGASTNMVRRYGRCPRGKRLVDATPWGHWKITTFVAGLRASGLIAPMGLDGPMTGEVFRASVEQVLIPELSPGDVVVLDNLAAHKVARSRKPFVLLAPATVPAAVLARPKPDRAGIYKAQGAAAQSGRPHQGGALSMIGELLDHFSAEECQNYLSNCGYEFT
ncbi:transposase, partial [Microvirga sp. P5_D2]